jgi:hypothetical protein
MYGKIEGKKKSVKIQTESKRNSKSNRKGKDFPNRIERRSNRIEKEKDFPQRTNFSLFFGLDFFCVATYNDGGDRVKSCFRRNINGKKENSPKSDSYNR